MISLSTLAFALASLAALAAAGALLTCFRLARDMDSLRSSNDLRWKQHAANIVRAQQSVSAKLAELDRRSPAKDAAEVVALREAVDSLKATQQRFAGKFYKQLQLDGGGDTLGLAPSALAANPQLNGLDPELAAELALQSAAPVAPGRST